MARTDEGELLTTDGRCLACKKETPHVWRITAGAHGERRAHLCGKPCVQEIIRRHRELEKSSIRILMEKP